MPAICRPGDIGDSGVVGLLVYERRFTANTDGVGVGVATSAGGLLAETGESYLVGDVGLGAARGATDVLRYAQCLVVDDAAELSEGKGCEAHVSIVCVSHALRKPERQS